jgi:predicted ArsR family transcriptional regulator
MDARELLAPDAGAPLGRSRARVLELLREAAAPLGVQEVAERCGLHPNTARFHLDALVAAGLATRDRGPGPTPAVGRPGRPRRPGRPGRPAIGYRAAGGDGPGAPAGERRYRLLAEMLASMIAGLLPDPATTAEQAGREWGSYLAQQPPPYRPPTAARALDDLTALLADMGFDPEVAAQAARPRIVLRECPFREVAGRHQAVVCSLHLGVIGGALTRMRAPLTVGRLEPFGDPGGCLVHLTHLGEDGAGEQDGEGVAGAAAAGR